MNRTHLSSQAYRERLEHHLKSILPTPTDRLNEAIHYSVFSGGKRLRPELIYRVGASCHCPIEMLDSAAAAIELMHCYSLIHDDLPAMDDDDLRRNQPSCHIQFDEATAILAGDTLCGLSFNCIINDTLLDAKIRLALLKMLSRANNRMTQGQSLDLQYHPNNATLDTIHSIHQNKTGALFEAAVLMAVRIANCKPSETSLWHHFAQNLGLIFQIQDDLLDHDPNQPELPSYPNIVGLKQTQLHLATLTNQAINSLNALPYPVSELHQLIKACSLRKE